MQWVYHRKSNTVQPYPGSGTICTLSAGHEAQGPLIAAAPSLAAALRDLLCLPHGSEGKREAEDRGRAILQSLEPENVT